MVVPRWVQLVLLPLALVALWAIAKAAGKVLVIFIVAGLIALILNPVVAFISRGRLPRGLAVLVVYVGFFLIVTGIAFLLANPISNQVSSFANDVPHITKEANKNLAHFQRTLNRDGIHVHFIKQGKTALQTLGEKVTKGAGSIVSFSGGVLTEVASALFDLVLIFVLSIYMLLYGDRIGALVRRAMPPGDGTPKDDYPCAGAERGRALRRRAAAVQPDHGRDRRPGAVHPRRARHLPGRRDLRRHLRHLLRLHGADPLRGADPRSACRRSSWRCSRTRSRRSG